jgi:predicted aspartyl protease
MMNRLTQLLNNLQMNYFLSMTHHRLYLLPLSPNLKHQQQIPPNNFTYHYKRFQANPHQGLSDLMLTSMVILSVLVDTGSSRSIIQPRIASFLNIPIHNLPSFSVMVGNGDHLKCAGMCKNVPLSVAEHTFSVSLYVLPIQGADIVLGVQWLQTLGPFVSDHTIPSIQFYYNGQLITLTGMVSPSLSLATFPQFNRMIHTNSIATLHTITMLPTEPQLKPRDTTRY